MEGAGDIDTEYLRECAGAWSLAEDQRLLQALQRIHEKVMRGCSETSDRIEVMSGALQHAALALSNVNNRFMSLSSSQFVERRVYDDDDVTRDTDVTDDVAHRLAPDDVKESKDPPDEASWLRLGIEALERYHEPLSIPLDSDSESDSDENTDGRLVLRLVDRYSDRPLPHLIGSHHFHHKWHAGLLPSESETDSCSEAGQHDSSEHSLSEREQTHLTRQMPESSSSSSASRHWSGSESSPPRARDETRPHVTAAEVAAQLAKRLASDAVQVPPVQSPPEARSPPIHRPLYTARPPLPQTGVLFPSEPPPLDDLSDTSDDHQHDIFSALHEPPQSPPYHQRHNDHSPLAHQRTIGQDVLDETESGHVTRSPPATVHSKKPVGGISVFGKQAGDSIGAAIIRRRQRPDGDREDSDTDSDVAPMQRNTAAKVVDNRENEKKEVIAEVEKERDIFDELFAKSEKIQQKTSAKTVKETKIEQKETKKIDLFDDSIFDDIDDIFSSNSGKLSDKQVQKKKSIFDDDDDDDLFADVAVKSKISETKSKEENKSKIFGNKTVKSGIFGSDDDLFTEPVKSLEKPLATKEPENKNNQLNSTGAKQFHELLDADDELFKDTMVKDDKTDTKKPTQNVVQEKLSVVIRKQSKTLFDDVDDDDLFSIKTEQNIIHKEYKTEIAKQDTKNDSTLNHQKHVHEKDYEQNSVKSQSNRIEQKVKEIRSTNVLEEGDSIKNNNNPKQIIRSSSEDDSLFNKPFDVQTKAKANEEIKKVDVLFTDLNEDDLFLNVNTMQNEKKRVTPEREILDNSQKSLPKVSDEQTVLTTQKSKSFVNSPDLFEDDIDDLFVNSNKENNNNATLKETDKADKLNFDNQTGKIIDNQKVKDSVTNGLNENIFTSSKEILNQFESIDKSKEISKSSIADSKIEAEDKLSVNKEESDIFIKVNNQPNVLKETKIINVNSADNASNIFEDKIGNNTAEQYGSKQSNENTAKTVPESPNPDIFANIFDDQPPVFEKPKEPKKSKNVNALFDDDSDDEALFFKKNETILDENPEEFSPKPDTNLFGIFHEEPPAIDVDFVNSLDKPSNFTSIPKAEDVPPDIIQTTLNKPDLFANDDFDDLFIPKTENVSKEQQDSKPETKNSTSIKPVTVNEEIAAKPTDIINKINESPEKPKGVDNADGCPTVEQKKIGKLKPMNFNINVNTLLPGASPKKTQKLEQTDGQTVSTNSKEELNTTQVVETGSDSKLVKSVSFDGEPESPTLDNKLSKERPKIQVKRRPSTRRARREAVKKSGIDFGEDSTDNSSSLDDHIKSKDVKSENVDDKSNSVVDIEIGPTSLVFDYNVSKEDKDINKEIEKTIVSTVNDIDKEKAKVDTLIDGYVIGNRNEVVKDLQPSSSESTPTRDVKSKIVYVLNDEDIFSTPKHTANNVTQVQDPLLVSKPPENSKTSKVLNIVDDADDVIFKTVSFNETEKLSDDTETQTITTLGKVYKNESKTVQTTKPSILDLDDDDDDLFKSTSKPEITVKQTEYKVSKSETNINEANETSTNKTKENIETKPVTPKPKDIFADEKVTDLQKVKKSLFDDVSDDDDLFSSKMPQSKAMKKSALFSSDSDEELFSGNKTKREDIKTTIPSGATRTADEKHQRQRKMEHTKVQKKRVTSIFGDDDDDDEELFGGRA